MLYTGIKRNLVIQFEEEYVGLGFCLRFFVFVVTFLFLPFKHDYTQTDFSLSYFASRRCCLAVCNFSMLGLMTAWFSAHTSIAGANLLQNLLLYVNGFVVKE